MGPISPFEPENRGGTDLRSVDLRCPRQHPSPIASDLGAERESPDAATVR